MEIWSEGYNKAYIGLVILLLFFAIMSIIAGIIGSIKGDVVKGLVVAIVISASVLFLCSAIYKQKKEKYLMLVVDANYIEIYNIYKKHEMVKKILIN